MNRRLRSDGTSRRTRSVTWAGLRFGTSGRFT
jgi:hypothetical protein